jgi:hypothetical protein
MQVEKEFGKLSLDQFERLVKTFPETREQRSELSEILKGDQEKLREVLGPSEHSWASIYELPFFEQMALLFILVGLHEPLIEAWQTDDPIESLSTWGGDEGALNSWYEQHESEIDPKHFIWMTVVFQRNILAIMLFHCSMGHLVQRAREGDDESLFHAVEVDRAVVGAPTVADRIARAELVADTHFFIRLRKALKGPSQKHMAAIQDLRYSIVALRSFGFDRFSDLDLERLFLKTRLYPNSAGALKNLRKHIQAARKLQPPDLVNSGGRVGPQ